MKKAFFFSLCSFLLFSCSDQKPEAEKTETTVASAEVATPPQPAEIGDPKYMDIGKKGLASLSAGDVDGWMNSYSDNVVWQWNNGDSLVGKPAVSDYWKKRRTDAIDSITFNNLIFLPLQVNQPQSIEQPGLWLLSWYNVNAKYKNGKRMNQAIHTAMHFNSADKIDRVVQYLDRVPINAAMAKK